MKDYAWLSFIMLPLGIWFYYDGSSKVALENEINDNGVETTGYPTYIEKSTGRRSSSYKCDLVYVVDGSERVFKKFPISGKLYNDIDKNDEAKRDTTFTIKYLKADPTKFIIVGDSMDHAFMMYLGMGMAVVGLLGTCYMVYGFVSSKTQMADV